MQVGDGSVITGNIWVELLLLQQWGDRRCFVTINILYFNMLGMVCLSFIVLPVLVKHIPVAAVVKRNVKLDGKMSMSNVHRSHTHVFLFCGGYRHVDAHRKYCTIVFELIFVIIVLQSVFFVLF